MFRKMQTILAGFALLLVAAIATPVQAQSWIPQFDANTHIYVDPALERHPTAPVDFNGMSDEVKALQKKHGLQVYIVATQVDYDLNMPRGPAPDYVNRVQSAWASRAGFPHEDFLLEVWVRHAGNPQKGSVAIYVGRKLVGYGFDAALLADRVNGPVTPALKQFMPADPHGALLQIIRNVNDRVDRTIVARADAERNRVENERLAKERAEQQRVENERLARERAAQAERDRIEAEKRAIEDAEHAKQMQFYAAVGIPTLLILGLLGFLTFRYRGAKERAQKILEDRRTELSNAGHWYVQLDEAYLGFLKRQTDWQKRFDPKGKTAKQFGEAIKWYAELTTRKLAAADMFERAETAFKSAHWPMTGGLEKAIAILTTEEVVVSDKQLSIEEAELFKGLVDEKKYAPSDLLTDMGELFDKTNKALAKIKKSMEGSEQNRKEIAEFLALVDALKAKLPESQLSFEPYQERYDALVKERDEVLATIDKDPLAAFEGTEKVEEDVKKLKADLEQAIEIKSKLVGTESEIAKAQKRVDDVRAQKVGYNYPEKGQVPADAKENFLLDEAGSNPDAKLSEARQHLADATKAVTAGRLAQAQEQKSLASEAAAAAVAVVETVLAAKAAAEKAVPAVRDNLARLVSELPAAGKDVAALKADFLAKNYAGQPEKLARATQVSQATTAELDKVRVAYFEQRFVEARKLIENTGADVQGSRNALVEIASRLKQLRDLREHAKSKTNENDRFAGVLKSKLKDNEFTTSKQTDSTFAGLLPLLGAQKTDVAKDITDWPAAAEAADKMEADLKKVDAAIASEKQAHELAGQRIEVVRAAIDEARRFVEHEDVRNPARQKLSDATQVLSALQEKYKVAKSDWAALAREADSKKTAADEAKNLAEADIRLARQIRDEYQTVETRIESLRTRAWIQTATWGGYSQVITIPIILDLGEAKRYLGQASADLSHRDYERAHEDLRRADSAASTAEDWANAQLALRVQEMIRQWQEIEAEKERQRREEERRRQEEEDRRRRQQEEEDRRRRDDEDRRRRDEDNSRSNSGGDSWNSSPSGGDSTPSSPSGGDSY